MSVSAHYAITCVVHDPNQAHIESVRVHPAIDPDAPGVIMNRNQVVELMMQGKIFKTVFRENGKWKDGASVERYRWGNEIYLQTEPNWTPRDNLTKLPQCR